MFVATFLSSLAWTVWCLAQLAFAAIFQKMAARQIPGAANSPEIQGRAAIMLAVRGNDPSFKACIASLLAQTYKNFEIHIVVDSEKDPALQAIQDAQDDPRSLGKLFVHVLESPLETCGLKCSALIHGINSIETDVEFITFVDSDVVVHPDWLHNLLTPLADSKVGVVTGNQWFEPPPGANAATLIRSIWNAGAMVPAVLYGNSWAGSLAMRKRNFDQAGLLEVWSKSIVDDGPISGSVKSLGLEVRFVPELLMVNQETCDRKYVIQYVRRMLTWSKLYDPTFLFTVGHAMLTAGLMLAVGLCTLLCLVTLNGSGAVVGIIGLILGAASSAYGYAWVRSPIAKMQAAFGRPLGKLSMVRLLKILLLTNITQLLYGFSLISAIANDTVRWRGATYQVKNRNHCRLLDYRPFERSVTDSSII